MLIGIAIMACLQASQKYRGILMDTAKTTCSQASRKIRRAHRLKQHARRQVGKMKAFLQAWLKWHAHRQVGN